MRATGIVRRIDDLGRVVIPKEIRRIMKIHDGDALEYFMEEDSIIVKKYDVSKEERDVHEQFVKEHIHELIDVHFDGKITRVITSTGSKGSSSWNEKDNFNMMEAIYYAMINSGDYIEE